MTDDLTSRDDPNGERRLRLVRPGDVPVSHVQIADLPDAYAVRRGGPAEAIIHRMNGRDWLVMYGHVPDAAEGAEQWRGSAVLASQMTHEQAAAAAIELVDACALLDVAPSWPELLGRLIDTGPSVAAIGRLHAPDRYGMCRGDDDTDPPSWVLCKTVRMLAASVGFDLVDPADALTSPEPCYQPSGYRAPEVNQTEALACAQRHPGRPCEVLTGPE